MNVNEEYEKCDYRITVRPLGGWGAPAMKRLARALKALLRSYGLKNLKVEYLKHGTDEVLPPRTCLPAAEQDEPYFV